MSKSKLIRINTTAFSEEDFGLFTDLTKKEITTVIKPIIKAERNGGKEYHNDDLVKALVKAYPSATIRFIADLEDITEISI